MEAVNGTVINVQELEPQLRHHTIFQLFDQLEEGEHLIIHNNHDPKPVYYQLQQIRGDIFTWEYLQQGPEWWDIKVTKKVFEEIDPEEKYPECRVINVPSIQPQYKHETIIEAFQNLSEGESFIIHNDHDPKPIKFQLEDLFGNNIVLWEYVEEGPKWWDIRVTKKHADDGNVDEIGEPGELIINIPLITDHRQKHATILNAFDELKAGESFIIHNDHDPLPVYYQLLDLHGETFSWEYLQDGPQWWDIRVRLNEESVKVEKAEKGELIIDVPSIKDHGMKHETILNAFENLKPGESFIIHNDHDPIPVRYQLQSIHGDVFTWDYLQEGPEIWDIRVRLNDENKSKMETTEELIIDVPSIKDHAQKHKTILDAFAKLQPGESFIIHNDHDPVPVRFQLQSIHGNVFSWEYLQKGSQIFDIRVRRNEEVAQKETPKAAADELVIDVPGIANHQMKHQTILDAFAKLKPGESFIIHNDHDPKPLFYQLQSIHGDVFTWDYLQEGPEIWDIRVKLVKGEETETADNAPKAEDEPVINVPTIKDHNMKHALIFKAFEALQPGKSFIIHNDHDPMPVRYQLKNLYGDIFTWTYLQEGPEIWDIRVRKNSDATNEALNRKDEDAVKENAEQKPIGAIRPDVVVDVPSYAPKDKHPAIFKVFDQLRPGESLIIHNDHDPKPLYYQLKAERGDIFTWNYQKEGPDFWDIKVTRKGAQDLPSIGEIVVKDYRKSTIFREYGIDFSCEGYKTVRQVCSEMRMNPKQLEEDLQKPIEGSNATQDTNYNDWDLTFLSNYIKTVHHKYAKKYIPEIKMYSEKVFSIHRDLHPELSSINDLIIKLSREIPELLDECEQKLFPLIAKMEDAAENKTSFDKSQGSFSELVKPTEEKQKGIVKALSDIRRLSKGYAVPEDACTSYKLEYKMMDEFEDNILLQFHLKNNILFKKAKALEKTL